MWRLSYSIPIWLIYNFLIFLPLCILGWILIPIAAAAGAYKKVEDKDGAGNPRTEYHFTWPFMFVFDNFEDGCANDTYVKFKSMFMKIVYWSCLRNPTNNMRIIPYLSCKINPEKVRFVGSFVNYQTMPTEVNAKTEYDRLVNKYDTKVPQWFFAWQNIWHSNLYIQFKAYDKLWRFWIGTAKIYPTDIFGIKETSYRFRGAGGVAQFKRVKV